MQDNHATEHQLDLGELASWERSRDAQHATLSRLRDAAVACQVTHVLTDPAGRVLAIAATDGTVHLLDPPVLAPHSEHGELNLRPLPGFYADRTRTYYVTAGGTTYRLRGPGQWATLQRIPGLPDDCEELDADDCDVLLCTLAEAADALEEAGVDPRRAPGARVGLEGDHDRGSISPGSIVYTRIDDLHFRIELGDGHAIAITAAAAGSQFQLFGAGRWDGERIVAFLPPERLTPELREGLESALRRAAAGL